MYLAELISTNRGNGLKLTTAFYEYRFVHRQFYQVNSLPIALPSNWLRPPEIIPLHWKCSEPANVSFSIVVCNTVPSGNFFALCAFRSGENKHVAQTGRQRHADFARLVSVHGCTYVIVRNKFGNEHFTAQFHLVLIFCYLNLCYFRWGKNSFVRLASNERQWSGAANWMIKENHPK